MGRRRTGTVYEKPPGSGVWYVALTLRSGKRWVGRIPPRPDGQAITEHDTDAFRAELVRRYEAREWDPEAPVAPAGSDAPAVPELTVADIGDEWVKGLVSWSNHNHECFLRLHIRPSALGAMKPRDVRPPHIAEWLTWMKGRPSSFGGTLAPRTIRTVYSTVCGIFHYAVFKELIPVTPCRGLPRGTIPKVEDKIPGARKLWRFPREEVEILLSHPKIELFRRVLWAISFLTGTRAAETVVLRWIDWEPQVKPLGRITVARALHRKTGAIKGTKTGAVREIPVHPVLAAVLAEWKLSGWEQRHGRRPKPEDLLVPTNKGTIIDPGQLNRWLKADCEALGLRKRKLHSTRHTLITLARGSGGRKELIKHITHPQSKQDTQDEYFDPEWDDLCEAMRLLPVARRPVTDFDPQQQLPLAASAEIATDTATRLAEAAENTGREESSLRTSCR